jgi:hypothetical protein
MNEIYLGLTTRERALLDQMRTIGGFSSDVDVLRSALWQYAQFLEVEGLRATDFELEAPQRSQRRAARKHA